jgi:hypothetical protein
MLTTIEAFDLDQVIEMNDDVTRAATGAMLFGTREVAGAASDFLDLLGRLAVELGEAASTAGHPNVPSGDDWLQVVSEQRSEILKARGRLVEAMRKDVAPDD